PGSGGKSQKDGRSSIPIRGLRGDLPVSFSDGGAGPGDRIVGILNPGQGITIYPIHAEALKAVDEEPARVIHGAWEKDAEEPAALAGQDRRDGAQRAWKPRPSCQRDRRGRRQY